MPVPDKLPLIDRVLLFKLNIELTIILFKTVIFPEAFLVPEVIVILLNEVF